MRSFKELGVEEQILQAITDKEISNPTEVQQKVIPALQSHTGDFTCRAATGTGKTIAFGVPLLQRISTDESKIQAIVLVPTRELCEQVGNELKSLLTHKSGIHVAAIYGGISLKSQTKELKTETHVIVATPGRMIDLLERKIVNLSALKIVVLDEADKMLLTGFSADIDKILTFTRNDFRTWLFSATLPVEVKSVIESRLTHELKSVEIGEESKTNEGITHEFIELIPEDKLSILLHYLEKFASKKSIVFCRTKSGVQKLYKQLSANKFKSGAIHGDLPQGLRNKVMDQFRAGHINILLATDVASRGVDISNVSHVIQYHIPDTATSYLHRSGRTSRAGETGTSLTFVFEEEKTKLVEIQEELGFELNAINTPSEADQLVNRAVLWARKVAKEKPIPADLLDSQSREEFKTELKHLSSDELLEKLLATYLRDHQ